MLCVKMTQGRVYSKTIVPAQLYEEWFLTAAKEAVRDQVTGIILAGGLARRMGGVDKGLVLINGRPMIAWAIDALRVQVAELLINANRNHDKYGEFGCAVIDDGNREFRGPLAGIASGMQAAKTPWIAVVPCDSPLICSDLVRRLHVALTEEGLQIAVAHDGERLQPVFAMLHQDLFADLVGYLDGGGRKIDRWYEKHGYATADFSDAIDTFSNVNAPADKRELEAELAKHDQPTSKQNE